MTGSTKEYAAGRKCLAILVGVASLPFLSSGCGTSVRFEGEGNLLGLRGKVTIEHTHEPEDKGNFIGRVRTRDGKVVDVFDIDGDGIADFAKDESGNWYLIRDIELVGTGLGGTAQHRGFATGHVYEIVKDLSGGECVSYDFGAGSDEDVLAQYGLNHLQSGGSADFLAFTSGFVETEDRLSVHLVMSTQMILPDLHRYELQVCFSPRLDANGDFAVYGLSLTGHAVEITRFAAAIGVTQLEFSYNGFPCMTRIDSLSRVATLSVAGIPYDTYSF